MLKLKKTHTIVLLDRDSVLVNGLPSIQFSNPITVDAKVCTLAGVKTFDGTNEEDVATHKILINYLPNITSEKFILFNSKYLRIINVLNCCEKNLILKLMCTERGVDTLKVNET